MSNCHRCASAIQSVNVRRGPWPWCRYLVFTGFLIDNRVAEAREQQCKTEPKKLDLSNRIALEVTDAYLTLQSARQQIDVEMREVESARSAMTLAKERYSLGLASIVDVTTATTALLLAEVRLSEARYAV